LWINRRIPPAIKGSRSPAGARIGPANLTRLVWDGPLLDEALRSGVLTREDDESAVERFQAPLIPSAFSLQKQKHRVLPEEASTKLTVEEAIQLMIEDQYC
jgi:hypothetical protein